MSDAFRPAAKPAHRLPAASWGQRAGALVVDLLIQFALMVGVAVLVGALTGWSEFRYESEDRGVTTTETAPYWAVWALGFGALCFLLYPWVLLGAMRGRTPGRRVAGIRVVDLDGTPVGFGKAFLREGVVKGMLGLFGLPLLLSYLFPLWDPHQRALHDLICATRAVQEGGDATDAFGGSTGAFAPPAPGPAPAAADPVPQAPPRRGSRPSTGSDRDDLAGRIGLDG